MPANPEIWKKVKIEDTLGSYRLACLCFTVMSTQEYLHSLLMQLLWDQVKYYFQTTVRKTDRSAKVVTLIQRVVWKLNKNYLII